MALDFKRVGSREVRARLASGDSEVDEELTRIGRSPVYRCLDGQALVLLPPENRQGMLYSSYEELRGWMRLQEALDRERPMSAAALLGLDETFISRVPDLIGKLTTVLVLEDGFEFDYSVASLESIDRIVRGLTYSRRLEGDVVLPLWAYVGEVIRRQTDGKWRLMSGPPGEPPEPMIVAGSSKRGVGIAGLYKELLEFSEESSLASVALMAIDYLGPALRS